MPEGVGVGTNSAEEEFHRLSVCLEFFFTQWNSTSVKSHKLHTRFLESMTQSSSYRTQPDRTVISFCSMSTSADFLVCPEKEPLDLERLQNNSVLQKCTLSSQSWQDKTHKQWPLDMSVQPGTKERRLGVHDRIDVSDLNWVNTQRGLIRRLNLLHWWRGSPDAHLHVCTSF